MQFSGVNNYVLPQVQNFSFCITGIRAQDTNPFFFKFYDTGNNSFIFNFSGGYIFTNRIIGTYNTIKENSISGFISNNVLNYKINNIFTQETLSFNKLSGMLYSGTSSVVQGKVFVNSNPINYSFSFDTQYKLGGILTGTLITDTTFDINSDNFLSLNSNTNLLSGVKTTGRMYSGTNYLTFQDVDYLNLEYFNNFIAGFQTTFGGFGGNYSVYRGEFYSNNVLNLTDYNSNVYSGSSLFDGFISGGNFYYKDAPTSYNLAYHLQNLDYQGNVLPISLAVKFEPLHPLNNSLYSASYITGFSITNSGSYSGAAPTASFNKYYSVPGISQELQKLLFSTGCPNQLQIGFGGACTKEASGYLTLNDVYISGFYGESIKPFKGVFGYTPYSVGSGYTGAPITIWGTGGSCFSLPDVSGAAFPFMPINGTSGAIVSHSDYLTGIPLFLNLTGLDGSVTGYKLSGLQITNIGSGYSSTFPPKITLKRYLGDVGMNNGSGIFLLKDSGVYDFTGIWEITYNFLDSGNFFLDNSGSFYTGNLTLPYNTNSLGFNIKAANIDNTEPISGLLTLSLGAYSSNTKNMSYPIYQNRLYNKTTGALN